MAEENWEIHLFVTLQILHPVIASPGSCLIKFPGKTLFLIFFKFIFRQREKVGEKEGEKHQCGVASRVLPTGDLAHNPGMCPDWQ